MAGVDQVQPTSDKMKKAIKWISETVLDCPDKKRKNLISEAQLRFDLSPSECEFLHKNFAQNCT